MKVVMIGSGYVGLVSGACFADFGHDVVCVDKDSKKIDALHKNAVLKRSDLHVGDSFLRDGTGPVPKWGSIHWCSRIGTRRAQVPAGSNLDPDSAASSHERRFLYCPVGASGKNEL